MSVMLNFSLRGKSKISSFIYLIFILNISLGLKHLFAFDDRLNSKGQRFGLKEEVLVETENYDVKEEVDLVRQKILDEREQLQEKKKTPLEKEEAIEEVQTETRRYLYQQRVIQEVSVPRTISAIELKLERERFRRELMTRASAEIAPPFRFRKRFHLRATETYDDNVYLTKINKKKDYITQISPGITFSLSSKYVILDGGYIMDIVRYKNRKDQNGVNHLFLTYIRPGSLRLPFFKRRGGKIGIEIQDQFQPFVTGIASSEQTKRTDRTTNKLFLAIDYYMSSKRTLSLEYVNDYNRYRTSTEKSFSYISHTISPTFYFHMRPKWSFFTAYDYGILDYTQGGTNDTVYQQLRAGIIGRIFNKVLAHIEVGSHWRDYKDESKGKTSSIILKSSLANRFSPSTRGSLTYTHILEESLYQNNPYYTTDTIDFNLDHKFTYKTSGFIGLKFTYNTYENASLEDGVSKKRQDNLWEATLGLRYNFRRWINMDLTYTRLERISNHKNLNFRNNKVVLGINAGF